MDSSFPPPCDWNENIPDDESFEDVKRRLSDELKLAAAKLVIHLNTTSFRIRLTGISHEIYITIGGGRHTDEYSGDAGSGANRLPGGASPGQSQHEPALVPSLDTSRPDQKGVDFGLTSTQEKFDVAN